MYESIEQKERKARKEHVCDWCGDIIHKGEVYEYQKFVYDYELCEWHVHKQCQDIVDEIYAFVEPYDGMSSDDFYEGCSEVSSIFVCPTCENWDEDYQGCVDDKVYCLDKMHEFFQKKELYVEYNPPYQVWKCRDKKE